MQQSPAWVTWHSPQDHELRSQVIKHVVRCGWGRGLARRAGIPAFQDSGPEPGGVVAWTLPGPGGIWVLPSTPPAPD